MDSLSIIAAITGTSQAGAALAKTIYQLIEATRNAPKEASDIARGLSDLSIILGELRRVLRDGKDLYRRKLLRHIRSAVRRIRHLQDDASDLIDLEGRFGMWKWAFRRSTSLQLLYQIEAHKIGISMVLHAMKLSVQMRSLSTRYEGEDETERRSDAEQDTILQRQGAENVVRASFEHLRDRLRDPYCSRISEGGNGGDWSPAARNVDLNLDISDDHTQLWRTKSDDAATWLYGLVFGPYAEAMYSAIDFDFDVESEFPPGTISLEEEEEMRSVAGSAAAGDDINSAASSRELVLRRIEHLGLSFRQEGKESSVVDELLADWTTLTENEIRGIAEVRNEPPTTLDVSRFAGPDPVVLVAATAEVEAPPPPSPPPPPSLSIDMIKFTDAVGRKFSLPWERVKTWQGMSELISEAFAHVQVVGPQVREGRYDIVHTEREEMVLPSIWEQCVAPGDRLEMRMWPEPESPVPNKFASSSSPAPAPSTPTRTRTPTRQSFSLDRDRERATTMGTPPSPTFQRRFPPIMLDKKTVVPLGSTFQLKPPLQRSSLFQQGGLAHSIKRERSSSLAEAFLSAKRNQ